MTHLEELKVILSYCAGRGEPFYVIHTPPHSTIGGFSHRLVDLSPKEALTEIANGDRQWVPLDEISWRLR